MADSNNVYKRVINWNEQIIIPINELATNPPGDCVPVDELPEAEENHLWTKQDIQDVHDKLKEICGDNEFDDLETPQLATVILIQQIEDAIENGWCDCVADFWIVDTITQTETCCIIDLTAGPDPDVRAWQEEFFAARSALDITSSEYYTAQELRCEWHHKALDLQDEIDQLEIELLQLQAASPPDAGAISAKQGEIDSKQTELDEAETKRDEYKGQAETAMAEWESNGTNLISAVSAAERGCMDHVIRLIDYIDSVPNTPWERTECENESNFQPKRGGWSLAARRTDGQQPTAIGGGFTPLGVPYPFWVAPLLSGGLVSLHMTVTWFTGGPFLTKDEIRAQCEAEIQRSIEIGISEAQTYDIVLRYWEP